MNGTPPRWLLVVSVWLCLSSHPGRAQRNPYAAPACKPQDLFATPNFSPQPEGVFTLAYDLRNISSHDCTLNQPQYPPGFVPDRLEGHPPIAYRWPSSPQPPLLLKPGQTDHLTYRWAANAADADHPCVPLKWIAGTVLIVAPTLLKPVCSEVEGGLYEPGPFNPEANSSAELTLTAPKTSFFLDEQFFLTLSGPRPAAEQSTPCPTLFRLERSPDGSTRFDELQGAGFAGCRPYWPGRQKGDWNTGFPVEAGSSSHWGGLGNHQFQLLEQLPSPDNTGPKFRRTQVLSINVADPSIIARAWGTRVRGVAADISLDKTTYELNEDIPLHLALENFNAAGPVHAWDPGWDPCQAIQIRVLDTHGDALPATSRQGMNFCEGHGFGPTKEFPPGKLLPIERSLTNEGWLPKERGTYTIVLTWTPLVGTPQTPVSVQSQVTVTILSAKTSRRVPREISK